MNSVAASLESRVPSGVHGLDALIGGGFPALRTCLVHGDSGAGKTVFALHFLMEGARRGERVILISADGTRPPVNHRLTIALAESQNFHELRGHHCADARQVESDLARIVRQFDATRVVIDDLPALTGRDLPVDRAEDFLRSVLATSDDNLGCTTLITARTEEGRHPTAAGTAAERLASGVIRLHGGPTDRWIHVRKMRGAPSALEPYFVGGLSAPRSLSASDPNPPACATLSRAV